MESDKLKSIVELLGPWRHDIDLGEFSTFDVAESIGPFADAGHPKPRAKRIIQALDNDVDTVVDLGCNAAGISFYLERAGYDTTAVDSSRINAMPTSPLVQARMCKQLLKSDITIVDEEVRAHIQRSKPYDAIVAPGILYHMNQTEDNSIRDELQEKRFVDLMMKKANKQVIIETDHTDWLPEYIDEHAELVVNETLQESIYGVRHFVVGDVRDVVIQ